MQKANQKQLQTIQLIKLLGRQLDPQSQQQIQDSLIVSESQFSMEQVEVLVKAEQKKRRRKIKQYQTKYVSPYKQHQISIDKIEASGRKRINPKINFSNTILQIVTNHPKQRSRNNSDYSRYRNSASLLDKIEMSALDRLRMEARQMYEIQQKQRKQIPPDKRSKAWADFLLRERQWQQKKKAKNLLSKQQMLLNERRSDQAKAKVKVAPRQSQGITRENLIRKIKREKGKLEQQLNSISLAPPRWRNINIRGDNQHSNSKQNKVRVSTSKEASFLLDYR